MFSTHHQTVPKGRTEWISPRATVGADSEPDWFGDDFLSASFSGNWVKDGEKDLYTFTETD